MTMVDRATITLIVPVRTSALASSMARNPTRWGPWTERLPLGESNARDWGRFFAGQAAKRLAPTNLDGRRYTWKPADTPMPWVRGVDPEIQGALAWIDAIELPEYSLLLIDLDISGPLRLTQLHDLKRAAGRMRPRYEGDDLPRWNIAGCDPLPMITWIRTHVLHGNDMDEGATFGGVDWFGHDVPAIVFALGDEPLSNQHCASALVTSATSNRVGYLLAPTESLRLRETATLHVWDDWQMAVGESSVAFLQSVSSENGAPLSANREIYLSMIALVFYQRIRLAEFLERFFGEADLKRRGFGQLCDDFIQFRARFLLPQLAVYPLGERIYQFVYNGLGVADLVVRLTAEITLQEGFERLAKDQANARLVAALAVIAAVFAPVGAIGALYSARHDSWQAFSSMWFVLAFAMALTLGLIAGVLLYNRRARIHRI